MGSIEADNRQRAGIEDPPQHVAVIMDGNGRWAKQRGLPRTAGHREGARAVREVVTRARELGIPYLTLYAFSTQNWQRPSAEVEHLMDLLVEFCEKERKLMQDKRIRLRMIGRRDSLPAPARFAVESVETLTRQNKAMQLTIALSYGGREEIVAAARTLATRCLDGELRPDDIDEDTFAEALWTSDTPDPDLLIRTSGEVRVSNFLLWQIAYAEMVIETKCWPDFQAEDFDQALRIYQSRDRRFGGVGSPG